MHAPADAVLCIQVRVHDSDRLAELRRVRVESEHDLASGVGVDGETTPDSGRRLRFNTISGASHFHPHVQSAAPALPVGKELRFF